MVAIRFARTSGRGLLRRGDRATGILGELHDWMARENATTMARRLPDHFGAKLNGDGISILRWLAPSRRD
jgi:hypothetical protein